MNVATLYERMEKFYFIEAHHYNGGFNRAERQREMRAAAIIQQSDSPHKSSRLYFITNCHCASRWDDGG